MMDTPCRGTEKGHDEMNLKTEGDGLRGNRQA